MVPLSRLQQSLTIERKCVIWRRNLTLKLWLFCVVGWLVCLKIFWSKRLLRAKPTFSFRIFFICHITMYSTITIQNLTRSTNLTEKHGINREGILLMDFLQPWLRLNSNHDVILCAAITPRIWVTAESFTGWGECLWCWKGVSQRRDIFFTE